MKFEIARLKRRGSRLAVAWLSLVWSSVALAQSTAPPVPSPNPEPVAAAPVSGRGRSTNDDGRGAAPETGRDEPTTPRAEPAVDSRTEGCHGESQCTGSPGCTASVNSGRTAPCWRHQRPRHPADDGVRLWWWRAHGRAERSGSPRPRPRRQHPLHPADVGVRLWWWRAHGRAERSGAPRHRRRRRQCPQGCPERGGRRRRRRSHLLRRKGHPRHRGDRAVREEVRQQRPLVLFAEQEFSVPPRRANTMGYYVVQCGQYRSVRPQRDRQAPRRHRPPPLSPPVRRGDVREYTVQLRI